MSKVYPTANLAGGRDEEAITCAGIVKKYHLTVNFAAAVDGEDAIARIGRI